MLPHNLKNDKTMAEVYAIGPNGERYKRKADYQAGRATKAKSARQRERRVYSRLRNIR